MNFECNICNKKYKSNKTLQSHINKFHKDNEIKDDVSEIETEDQLLSNTTNEEPTEENNRIVQEILEDEKGEKILYDTIVQILGDSIIENKKTKEFEKTVHFINEIETNFINVVLEEAGITSNDLTLFTVVDKPIHPDHMGSVIGCYIKYLRHQLDNNQSARA